MPEPTEIELTIPEVLKAHRWTNRSRCECGWTVRPCIFPEPQVSGLAQFEAHVAGALAPLLADLLAGARAGVLREHADREVAHEGYTMAVERLLAHAAEHDGHLSARGGDDRG